jgi:hypothetical protein
MYGVSSRYAVYAAVVAMRNGGTAVGGPMVDGRDAFALALSQARDAGADLAREMVSRYNPASVQLDTEYGGFIYESANGTVGATDPISSSCNGGVSCQLDLGGAAELIPDDAAIIYDWHTHGAAPPDDLFRWERFSYNDVLTTNQLGAANNFFRGSFLGTPQGRLFFLRPGVLSERAWSERAIRRVQEYRGRIPR